MGWVTAYAWPALSTITPPPTGTSVVVASELEEPPDEAPEGLSEAAALDELALDVVTEVEQAATAAAPATTTAPSRT